MKLFNLMKRAGLVAIYVLLTSVVFANDLTPYAYVELTKASTQQKAQDLSQLIGAISIFTDVPEAWISEEAQMTEIFDTRFSELYELFGTTAAQYLLYYSDNQVEIESYLDIHQDDRELITQYSAEVADLLIQYEQLKINLLQLTEPSDDDPLPIDSQ